MSDTGREERAIYATFSEFEWFGHQGIEAHIQYHLDGFCNSWTDEEVERITQQFRSEVQDMLPVGLTLVGNAVVIDQGITGLTWSRVDVEDAFDCVDIEGIIRRTGGACQIC